MQQNELRVLLVFFKTEEAERGCPCCFDLGVNFDRKQFYVNAQTVSNTQLEVGDIVLIINGTACLK